MVNEPLLSAFITLLVVIDPVGLAVIFAGMTHRGGRPYQSRMAVKGVVLAALVLYVFALVGKRFLDWLGVGLPAFRVAGGALLFLLAIDMLFARESGLRSTTEKEQEEAGHKADISVFPLAIPLIAGPGALTTIVLLMVKHAQQPLVLAGILAMVALVLVLTLAALLFSGPIMSLLGVTGANVVSRVLGLILAALAVQFVLDGLETGIRLI